MDSEKLPLIFLLLGMGVLGTAVIWHYKDCPLAVFRFAPNAQKDSVGVVIAGEPENQHYHYEYVVREPYPCPLSRHPDCPGWVSMQPRLKVYPVKLAGSDQLVGMAARQDLDISAGTNIVCDSRKQYLPMASRSRFKIWYECTLTASGAPKVYPIHQCHTSAPGHWISACPDPEQVQKRPRKTWVYDR